MDLNLNLNFTRRQPPFRKPTSTQQDRHDSVICSNIELHKERRPRISRILDILNIKSGERPVGMTGREILT